MLCKIGKLHKQFEVAKKRQEAECTACLWHKEEECHKCKEKERRECEEKVQKEAEAKVQREKEEKERWNTWRRKRKR